MTLREIVNNTCSPELVAEMNTTMDACHSKMVEFINAFVDVLGWVHV